MSYLLDKKVQRKKFLTVAFSLFIFCVLFYFRLSIWNGLSYVSHFVFSPILVLGNSISDKLGNLGYYFISKNSLYLENENLKAQILESQADRANYASVVADNASLKEILGRKDSKMNMVLSAILSKPNQSPYDTLVIDVGTDEGLKVGDMVFAFGNIPIGRLGAVYPSSSKVVLFSTSGEKTQVVVGNNKRIFMEIIGRGGGNFEMTLSRDMSLLKGDQVVLPGIVPHVVGVVETIISDPRDPFQKALLTSPVNIQELKFVEVKVSAK